MSNRRSDETDEIVSHKKRGSEDPLSISPFNSEGVLDTQFTTDAKILGIEITISGGGTQFAVDINTAGESSGSTNLTSPCLLYTSDAADE